jgi:hypothetical protein
MPEELVGSIPILHGDLSRLFQSFPERRAIASRLFGLSGTLQDFRQPPLDRTAFIEEVAAEPVANVFKARSFEILPDAQIGHAAS